MTETKTRVFIEVAENDFGQVYCGETDDIKALLFALSNCVEADLELLAAGDHDELNIRITKTEMTDEEIDQLPDIG